jgi:hypothetical protein
MDPKKTVFQYKITLRDIEPEIWRRIGVPPVLWTHRKARG